MLQKKSTLLYRFSKLKRLEFWFLPWLSIQNSKSWLPMLWKVMDIPFSLENNTITYYITYYIKTKRLITLMFYGVAFQRKKIWCIAILQLRYAKQIFFSNNQLSARSKSQKNSSRSLPPLTFIFSKASTISKYIFHYSSQCHSLLITLRAKVPNVP